jgi:hypothetical protein
MDNNSKTSNGEMTDQTKTVDTTVNGILNPDNSNKLMRFARISLDNVAYQDFSEYQYIFDPSILDQSNINNGENQDIDVLQEKNRLLEMILGKIYNDVGTEIDECKEFLRDFAYHCWWEIRDYFLRNIPSDPETAEHAQQATNIANKCIYRYLCNLSQRVLLSLVQDKRGWPDPGIGSYERHIMADLIGSEWYSPSTNVWHLDDPGGYPNGYWTRIGSLDQTASNYVQDSEIQGLWSNVLTKNGLTEKTIEDLEGKISDLENYSSFENITTGMSTYKFNVFDYNPNSAFVNLGLRLIYRQEWRPIGDQVGEIVKTIPLGPKQVEKVSTKITKRTKITKTSENIKSTESTTETSDSSKDSSEVVQEAKDSLKWNVEVDASCNFGVGSASTKDEIGGNQEQSSKSTSSHLSETMKKTANKIHTETKVTVSTEHEEAFEYQTSSEIQNPNEEIAITYVYAKWQRQYDVFTHLAEVQRVVMIPEYLPMPSEITIAWIKQYDWIIAKVLLDDSFRDILTSIGQDVDPYDDTFKLLENTLSTALGENTGKNVLGGTKEAVTSLALTGIDLGAEAQTNYSQAIKERIQKQKERDAIIAKRRRFIKHIQDNILHYMRAIWSAEDPDQRLLRYQKSHIKVPAVFQVDVTDKLIQEIIHTLFPSLQDELNRCRQNKATIVEEGNVKIPIVPSKKIKDMWPSVADMIIPAGPIGFHGNYAIFYLKPEYAGKFPQLECYLSNYARNGVFHDPALTSYESLQDKVNCMVCDTLVGWSDFKCPICNCLVKETLDFLKQEMVDVVPELRLRYSIAVDAGKGKLDVFLSTDYLFKYFYPEYLCRKDLGSKVLVDTNNLAIDILPGTGSALEPFKLAHRSLDVQKVQQEVEKAKQDNIMRQAIKDKGIVYDPDIAKTVIVTDSKATINLVGFSVEGTGSSTNTPANPSAGTGQGNTPVPAPQPKEVGK